ncbi:MAG: NfeD family protein [Oscillospiraceae bacterium]|jgi:membrane protein implicated in regulation of membrane protease activity|nr:NfeD family protein [Oscillospiraceae bacterium]
MPYWAWLLAIAAFLVVEGVTVQLVSAWFAIGSLAGLIANLCGAELWLQLTVFAVVTVISLIAMRPLIKKINKTANATPTNADRCIGETAIVTEEINNLLGKGQVTVSGIPWTVRSTTDAVVPVGTPVRVEEIQGVKLIVSVVS